MNAATLVLTVGLVHLGAMTLSAADLSGRVVDVTGGPLPSTKVELRRDGDPQIIGSVFTDLSGRFRFEKLLAGSYHLSFACTGFLPAKVVNTILASEVTALGDVVLQLAPVAACPASWELPTILMKEIKRGAELLGKAEDRESIPLRRATVTLNGSGHRYRTFTDTDGSFSFVRIKPGHYTLHVIQPGYAEFRIDGIQVKDRHRSEISDSLQLWRCPGNVNCQPVRKVLKINICL